MFEASSEQESKMEEHRKSDSEGDKNVEGKNVDLGWEEKREHWGGKLDFILSCVGFSVGLGNVWRFPYLCYKNGGGAFLIPYVICLVCGGVPIYFMEVALGQFMQLGGVGCWKICPAMQGIGVATIVVVAFLNLYYIVIMSWAGYYFVMGLTSGPLPWSHCNNTWNTCRCASSFQSNLTNTSCEYVYNSTHNATDNTTVDPVVEFWENKILEISEGIDHPDGFVWQLVVSLAVMWIVVYFCIFLGVKWTGKVVYFTAIFPYVVLTIMLIRGATLPGALDGIIYYLKPDFDKLLNAQVWIDAGTQIFFSYAIANGALPALGSYNKFHHNCYRDCIIISCINSGTSFYAGFAIFSVLGFMAQEQRVNIDSVAVKGPGLAFIAYPKAVTQMPVAPLWSAVFFIMIFVLGLDSQFVAAESVITAISDRFPVLRRSWKRPLFVLFYCCCSFLIGLAFVTRGGMYIFQIFDFYAASGMVLLFICFFETITVAWIYGGGRFYDNIELMIGFRINPWLRICWTVLAPGICLAIFLFQCVTFEELTYNKTYIYPPWSNPFGICLAAVSMVCIPVGCLVQFARADGDAIQRVREIFTPVLQPWQTAGKSISNGGATGAPMYLVVTDPPAPTCTTTQAPRRQLVAAS